MSSKLAVAAAVIILFGSTSARLAAAKTNHHHHHPGRASSTILLETRDPGPPRVWGGCATDDGQGRMRPCDAGGG